jgi:hypothetical protein
MRKGLIIDINFFVLLEDVIWVAASYRTGLNMVEKTDTVALNRMP